VVAVAVWEFLALGLAALVEEQGLTNMVVAAVAVAVAAVQVVEMVGLPEEQAVFMAAAVVAVEPKKDLITAFHMAHS
jgi:replication-associated recombination protein RarA